MNMNMLDAREMRHRAQDAVIAMAAADARNGRHTTIYMDGYRQLYAKTYRLTLQVSLNNPNDNRR